MHVTSATGSRGFTLLELLVVLTIVVLMTAAWPLAAPHVFPTQRLRNEARQLGQAIRMARMTARLTGTAQELEISTTGTAYRIASELHELPDGLTMHVRRESSAGATDRLTLFPDGSSSGATVDLSLHERVASVRVMAVTGRVEMDE